MAQQRWPDGKSINVPNARVFHRVPANRVRLTYFLHRCYNEGRGKAELAALVGKKPGLAAERDYTRRVLPAGAARR